MPAADRYVRRGTEVPVIYPGTLRMMMTAEKEAFRASQRLPGRHLLFAVHGRQSRLLRVYEQGECTWVYTPEES
jgi:hypothetical protein